MCRAEVWVKANLVPAVHKQRARVSESRGLLHSAVADNLFAYQIKIAV